jgi:hypothetical protein
MSFHRLEVSIGAIVNPKLLSGMDGENKRFDGPAASLCVGLRFRLRRFDAKFSTEEGPVLYRAL